ncbi:hypothetical protein TI39_contig47g00008 [Zymoseptoria brevis]|uniref:Uncharacterized protein n=1 Tax=Zymoseptoria brevis TaxID=1047168 RepID=A0A0F4GYP6_9PEZI|nr:hypothetical protein TI39_contig47g00008 [Zymoseptoria brevis]
MSVEQRSLTMEKQTASFADISPPRRLNTTPHQKTAYTLSAPPQLPARHVHTDSSADFSPIKERRSFSSSTKVESSSFGAKLRACLRGMFLCCTGCDGDEGASSDASSGGGVGARRKGSAKTMIISAPTNFRREEIHIAGLTPEQEHLIRQKASSDAQRQWTSLSPLRSLPPESFAERPVKPKISSPTKLTSTANENETMTLPPTYEEFTQPRSAPATPFPTVGGPPREGSARPREKPRTQSRRVSGNFVPGKRTSGNFSGARIFATGDGAGRTVSGGSGNMRDRAVAGGSGAGDGLGLTGLQRSAASVPNFALPRTPPPAVERVDEEVTLQGREGRM